MKNYFTFLVLLLGLFWNSCIYSQSSNYPIDTSLLNYGWELSRPTNFEYEGFGTKWMVGHLGNETSLIHDMNHYLDNQIYQMDSTNTMRTGVNTAYYQARNSLINQDQFYPGGAVSEWHPLRKLKPLDLRYGAYKFIATDSADKPINYTGITSYEPFLFTLANGHYMDDQFRIRIDGDVQLRSIGLYDTIHNSSTNFRYLARKYPKWTISYSQDTIYYWAKHLKHKFNGTIYGTKLSFEEITSETLNSSVSITTDELNSNNINTVNVIASSGVFSEIEITKISNPNGYYFGNSSIPDGSYWIVKESATNKDWNGDGDQNDLVILYKKNGQWYLCAILANN